MDARLVGKPFYHLFVLSLQGSRGVEPAGISGNLFLVY
jgi:hypothetical protein